MLIKKISRLRRTLLSRGVIYGGKGLLRDGWHLIDSILLIVMTYVIERVTRNVRPAISRMPLMAIPFVLVIIGVGCIVLFAA